jgi:CHAT domain-containing protein
VRRLEQQVRAHEWTGSGVAVDQAEWSFPELTARLGTAALISFLVVDGQCLALSYVDGRCRFHRIGKASAIDAAVRTMRFGATLLMRGQPSAAMARSASEVDELLLGPLSRVIKDRPLVVVPAGDGHAVPWAALPSCRGRAVSVTPSISAWLRATAEHQPGERVWVAGPRLRHAGPEARSLHATHGGQLLTARRATVRAVLAAMDGADLVHIAAHGQFRDDQPLFSSVELADGPLYGYDVQRLDRPPRLVVLSACDAGRAVVKPGGEVMGLATALLRSGTATVIASVLPVPDRAAVGLVTALHGGLRSGLGPAAALAAAQAEHGHLGFVCFGAG